MSEVYVQVLYDFHYHTDDGNKIKMKAGEELLLVRKSNENWWQVIRDSENQPFYAPASYLSIIGLNCKDSKESIDVNSNVSQNGILTSERQNNMTIKPKHVSNDSESHAKSSKTEFDNGCVKRVTDALSFRNPLCENEFLSFDYSHNDCQQKEVPFINESMFNKKIDTKNSGICEHSFSQESMSPIYVNIPLSFGLLPPIPKTDEKPLRRLTNNWFEYLDEESNRKYYFHSASGKATWKPPRRLENMQSTPLSSGPNSPKSNNSLNVVPDPPPKQLKPKLKKLVHSSNESLESQSSPCMFTILPPGWSQESDSSSGMIYYYNEATKKKWYTSADENGRTYFYDENNSESLWELPDVSLSSDIEESKQCQVIESSFESSEGIIQDDALLKSLTDTSTSQILRKAPKVPVPRQFKTRSLIVPECVNLSGAEDNRGFLPPSFGEGYWPSVQNGHFSITRKGTLNKTKLVEGGKRIRKNWTSSFVVLTDVFLLFYKDIRSAHLGTPGIKPELCIDLNGALVEWCPDKSSRKNVFQISTILGHQLLLQDDNAQTTREWFETIQAAIMMLPSGIEQADVKYSSYNREDSGKKDVKLSRSKSTKHYPSGKNSDVENEVLFPAEKKRKIRDKLRQFFVRRPTQESLREKGILLDEPVFGCHLVNLCSRESRKVPKFVSTCIEVIEEKELTADGLYRASGNLSQVQKIRIHVNQDDYSCLKDEDDVHVLTGALKMFFREMKEPLFPFNMFDKFLNAIGTLTYLKNCLGFEGDIFLPRETVGCCNNDSLAEFSLYNLGFDTEWIANMTSLMLSSLTGKQGFPLGLPGFSKQGAELPLPDANSKLEALKKLVLKMPEANYATLKVLLEHLLRVTEYHKQNRMQVQNLAIVFGPTLLWPEQVSTNIALDMMHQNRIVEFLLLEFNALFSGDFVN